MTLLPSAAALPYLPSSRPSTANAPGFGAPGDAAAASAAALAAAHDAVASHMGGWLGGEPRPRTSAEKPLPGSGSGGARASSEGLMQVLKRNLEVSERGAAA